MMQNDLLIRRTFSDDRKMWRLSRAELERRWTLVRRFLAERDIDALVVQSFEDKSGGYVRWFADVPTGYPRTLVFHAHDLMTAFEHGPRGQRQRHDGKHEDHPGVGEIIYNWSFQNAHYTQTLAAEDVVAELKSRGYRRIALVGALSQPYGFVSTLTVGLGETVEIIDATDAIDRMKAVKSAEETGLIEATARMQDDVFERVLAGMRPGMHDFEINALADYESQLRGAERGTYIGGSAPLGTAAPHVYRHFQARTMRAGDYMAILLESNGYGGYWTELSRPVVFGKATPALRSAFELAKATQEFTSHDYRVGATCAGIAERYNAFLRDNGVAPERRVHSHSQGYDMVERPLIREDEQMAIEAGMNFAIHPTVRTDSAFGHICDNFLVDIDGNGRFLHRTAKAIFEL